VIYLIVKMFLYLACALALGVAGGWLLRNVQAAAREQSLERQLLDANGRLPSLESMLQTCEQRLGGLHDELRCRDETLSLRNREIESLEQTLAELRDQLATANTPSGPVPELAPDYAADLLMLKQTARLEVLETALQEANAELERAHAALAAHKRRLASLMRERALQQAALQALEQRLESTRDRADDDGRRAANVSRDHS
jgi:chromosome segregation ATPase